MAELEITIFGLITAKASGGFAVLTLAIVVFVYLFFRFLRDFSNRL